MGPDTSGNNFFIEEIRVKSCHWGRTAGMRYPYVSRTETQTEDFGKTIGGSHRQAKKEKEFRRGKKKSLRDTMILKS